MHLRVLLSLCLFFISGMAAYAQLVSRTPLKTIMVTLDACSIKPDSNTLIPNTILIKYENDTIKNYQLFNNEIKFNQAVCTVYKGKSLTISYRSFDFNIEKTYFRIDTSLLTFKEKSLISGYEYNPNGQKKDIIDSKGLDYKGSFSRGLSVGNSQSLVLNSNFDMQLIGDLGNGLKVVAAISDENLPIQAQGNTQQLQEFDKVFIQVSKDRSSITAGDYELRKPNSYFMNYFKKLKGITLASTIQTNKDSEVFTKGSFAISRGKFARQFLTTKEGNQGPYRLEGNNGERFIIVLAGTEKIYFNGILLTRGFDYDYVIDYNRADITFSPNRVVARDSRVIVEFEYTDISYLRSLYATQTEYKSKYWNVNVNFYSEQDSKTSTGDVQLDSTDILILEQSGDDPTRSVRKSLRLVTDADKKEITKILYVGLPDPLNPAEIILSFTENIDSAQYTAVFTEVGQGKGDYIIDNTKNKNARVYKYSGKNLGQYLPVIQLIPPEQKQLITVNGSYYVSEKTNVFAEMGLSNLDKNRRSAVNNNDNVGWSSHLALNHSINLDSAATWKLKATVKHEHIDKYFNALNPFRVPEFTRDWNIAQITQKGSENLIYSNFSLANKSGFTLDYGFNSFDKKDIYNGKRHEASVKYDGTRLTMRAYGNVLFSSSPFLDQNSTFIRPNVTVAYKLGANSSWAIGGEFDAERNERKSISADTLITKSYAFQNLKCFIANDFTRDFALKFSFAERNDYFANKKSLQHAATANEIEIAG
ncbi:MAG: hypothetical protein IPO92_14175 [Saprospiraceae bacterium]|nr:hypothetical protein [Saprospiraceae bacterium]